MIIYHGSPSPNSIEQCRNAAPSYTHGAEWAPAKMTPHDWPYILDNGAFKAFVNNVPWDATAFVSRLNQIESMPRDPDFVVLPDVVTDPEGTIKRSTEWADFIRYDHVFAVQDGITPKRAVDVANRLECEGLFIGGTVKWKRENAETFVTEAHENDLICHIGRPGDLVWAEEIGADSVDLTGIVRDQAWHRLERLEQAPGVQSKLGASNHD